jgi:hypothetical protein
MTTDTAQVIDGAPQAAPMAPPKVRMDRSRTFSTVHGERGVDDPHRGVVFIQDGIPCDASGFFIFDHPSMQEKGPEGDRRRKMAEKHIKRAMAQAAKAKPKAERAAPADDDDDDEVDGMPKNEGENDDDDDGLLSPVSLGEWLRGGQEVVWNDVSQEIARIYKKRIAKIEDAVAFLVKEGVCTKGELRPKFKKFAD